MERAVIILACLLPSLCFGQFRPPSMGWGAGGVAPANLHGAWTMDAANGQDWSGYGRTATNVGAVVFGNGYYAGTASDNLDAGNQPDVESFFTGSSAKVSVSLWIKPKSSLASVFHIGMYGRAFGLSTYSDGVSWRLLWISDDATKSADYRTTHAFSVGNWSHHVVTWDATQADANKVRWYINGTEPSKTTLALTTAVLLDPAGTIWNIGGLNNASRSNSDIDSVYLFDTALTLDDAKKLYEQGHQE